MTDMYYMTDKKCNKGLSINKIKRGILCVRKWLALKKEKEDCTREAISLQIAYPKDFCTGEN